MKLWFWSCGCVTVAVERELWLCSCICGAVNVEMWLWSCGSGAVATKLWLWSCGVEQDFRIGASIPSWYLALGLPPYESMCEICLGSQIWTESVWSCDWRSGWGDRSEQNFQIGASIPSWYLALGSPPYESMWGRV